MSAPTGMGRGKVYPSSAARHLLNPLRHLVQPPSRVVRRMELAPTHRILELGCGPGWFSPALARMVPAGQLVVCDLQQEMILIARERTVGYHQVAGVTADASSLPFADCAFDAVLLATMLGEVPHPERCLMEVRRLLTPTGSLTVSETRRDSDFVTLDRLRELATKTGFSVDSVNGPRWEYTARLRRA